MTNLTFYRQARRDGGMRTGIDINGESVWAKFDEGSRQTDPTLDWYVDVRCTVSHLPRPRSAAREWLLKHESIIASGLRAMAKSLSAGMDSGAWPIAFHVAKAPKGSRIKIVCSVADRLAARQIDRVLISVADNLHEYVANLEPVRAAEVA